MSESYYVRFEAETTEEEHAILKDAVENDVAFDEVAISRANGRTIINNADDGVGGTVEIEQALVDILEKKGMDVVFAYGGEQDYGESWFSTLSRDGVEDFDAFGHVRALAREKSARLKEERHASPRQ